MNKELINELQRITWRVGQIIDNDDLIAVMAKLKYGSIGNDNHRLADYSIQFNDICDQLKKGGI
jgi:hypothetical protein